MVCGWEGGAAPSAAAGDGTGYKFVRSRRCCRNEQSGVMTRALTSMFGLDPYTDSDGILGDKGKKYAVDDAGNIWSKDGVHVGCMDEGGTIVHQSLSAV